MISYIYTSENISAYIAGKAFVINKTNPKFNEIFQGLKDKKSAEEMLELFNQAEALVKYINKAVSAQQVVRYEDGVVYVNNLPAAGPIVEKIKQFKAEGLDPQPLLNYFERLQANPSARAVAELYTFLERENLPITPEGHILAYKAVRPNWYDKHSGKICNALGTTVTMPRNQVSDDADEGCGAGLHAGSLGYVKGFAMGYGNPDGDKIVIVKIDPADVVSIPKDSQFSKMRVCKYTVMACYEGPLPEVYVPTPETPYAASGDGDWATDGDDSDA